MYHNQTTMAGYSNRQPIKVQRHKLDSSNEIVTFLAPTETNLIEMSFYKKDLLQLAEKLKD